MPKAAYHNLQNNLHSAHHKTSSRFFIGGVSKTALGLTLHLVVFEKVLLGHGHQLAVAWVIRTHHADDGLVDLLVMVLAVGAEFVLGLGWTGDQDFMHALEGLGDYMVEILFRGGVAALRRMVAAGAVAATMHALVRADMATSGLVVTA